MDHRDFRAMYGNDWEEFDSETMKLTYLLYSDHEEEELVSFPAKYEVCNDCSGRGTHVNPGIDSHGISQEEFDDDPDFRENYFGGVYDVTCYNCKGLRVIPTISENLLTETQKSQLERLQEKLEDDAAYRDEDEHCRRMGY